MKNYHKVVFILTVLSRLESDVTNSSEVSSHNLGTRQGELKHRNNKRRLEISFNVLTNLA